MIPSLELSALKLGTLSGLGSTGLDSTSQNNIWWFLIRSKQNDLLNYFVHDKRDLSPAYVKKCERFLWSLRNAGLITKPQANTLFKLQASSSKRHEPDTIKRYKKL